MARQQLPAFHAFTIKYSGRVSRITTELVVFSAFDPANPPSSFPTGFLTAGLWDTGATMSLITPRVVDELQLAPSGVTNLNYVGGTGITKTYVVNLRLPNKVMIGGVLVAEGILADELGAIIGMDVISQSDFAITNVNGQSKMSFRHPSVSTIDYVTEANRIVYAGINRNAPCPCGAKDSRGRRIKYKNCHGAIANQQHSL